MKLLFFHAAFLLIFLFLSCKKDKELINIIDFEKFTLNTPPDWKRFEAQGYDTFVGGLTNKKDTLYFDYGLFSFGSLNNIKRTSGTLIFETLKINGYDAKIVKEKRPNENRTIYSMYVDKKDNENINRIYGYEIRDEKLVRKIFLSHKFK